MRRRVPMRKGVLDAQLRAGGSLVPVSVGLPAPGLGTGSDWFGPSQPISPFAPPEVRGRRFDYPVGANLQIRTRAYDPVSFDQLRTVADGYDIMRIVIETIKDKVARQPWNIVPRRSGVKLEGGLLARAQRIEDMLRRPDGESFWNEWLRSVLEDLLVLDAPAIFVQRTLDGSEVLRLEQMDGATIKRVITDDGRTPEPPYAAYQQILKGLPANNYTREEIIYRPRNLRVHKIYGFSPVEQVLMTVNIAVRRQMWQLAYFTDGNVPDSLIGVPSTWTPDQIKQFQDWFDALLSGNTNRRRGATFVPGEVAKSYVPTKDAEIFGAAEEWLARVVCFSFGVSPHWAIKGTNRAEAEVHKSESEEDGLGPYKGWVKNLVDSILIDCLGEEELEFGWHDEDEVEPKTKAEVHKIYLDTGVLSKDEVREDLGRDPRGDESAEPTVARTETPVSLDEQVRQGEVRQEVLGPPPAQPGDEDEDQEEEAEKLAKAAERDPAPLTRRLTRRRMRSLERTVAAALRSAGDDVAAQVERLLGRATKADEPGTLVDEASIAQTLSLRLDLSDLEELLEALQEELDEVARDAARLALDHVLASSGGDVGIVGVGVSRVDDLFEQVNDRAVGWAAERAAEMVGRRRLPDGTLIENPNPRWAITQSTREMVRDTIEGGLRNNKGAAAIVDELQESFAFSPSRARTISRTEIAMANSEGAMIGYRGAVSLGIQTDKEWLLGPEPCNVCIANAAQGPISMDEPFQSGDMNTPAHPNCVCATVPVIRRTLS